MAELIIMPKLGFNMNEGKLVKWYKSEGDTIKKGENVFSVETDKTNMDIEATGDGIVRKLLIKEGDQIPVTLPIAIIGGTDENIDGLLAEALALLGRDGAQECDRAKADGDAKADAQKTAGRPGVAGEGCGSTAKAPLPISKPDGNLRVTPRARRVAAENGLALDGLEIPGTGFQGGICEKDILNYLEMTQDHLNTSEDYLNADKGKVSPLARAAAVAEGVTLGSVTGSGSAGKIMKRDVLAAAAGSGFDPSDSTCGSRCTSDGKEILEEVPYAGVRRIIGEKLSASMFTSPHLYFTQKVNMEQLLEIRKQINCLQDRKTSVTDYIARAAVLALQKYPDMNASLIGETIVKYSSVNIGIAVASPTGLIVPNVKHAEGMSLVELSRASEPLFHKAREGMLTPDEYSGGTFTISNLGMFGIENFTAIINPPEMGILAVSSTKEEPVVIDHPDGTKKVAIKPMMNIQLSTDHRVIDGLLAAQFVTEIKTLLENPISLLV